MKSIATDDFKDANNLDQLFLQGNQLQALPANVFSNAQKLVEIDVSNNRLTTIEDYAFSGSNLHFFHLKNNSLTVLKRNTFAGAPDTMSIALQDNCIESIENGTFDLPKLVFLFLQNNRIQSLSDDVFRIASKLVAINIDRNGLKRIGKAFQNCNQLNDLRLNYNQIEDIDLVVFAKLPKLKSLRLKNSGFQWGNGDQWPDIPSNLPFLDISNNSLTGSDVLIRLRNFSSLSKLDITDNNFSELNGFGNIKEDFPQLYELSLSGNTFTCAELQSIVDGLQAQNVTVTKSVVIDGSSQNYEGVTCV